MAKGRKTGGRKPGVPNKATRELKEIAQQYTTKAIHTLLDIMEHGQTEAARVAAAREVLDRGYGRPAGSGTQVNVSAASGQQLNIVCTPEEREALIAQRERLLAGSKTPPQEPQPPTGAPKLPSDTQASSGTPKMPNVSPTTLLEPLGPGDDEQPTWEEEEPTY